MPETEEKQSYVELFDVSKKSQVARAPLASISHMPRTWGAHFSSASPTGGLGSLHGGGCRILSRWYTVAHGRAYSGTGNGEGDPLRRTRKVALGFRKFRHTSDACVFLFFGMEEHTTTQVKQTSWRMIAA
jgi:hypothetical protein